MAKERIYWKTPVLQEELQRRAYWCQILTIFFFFQGICGLCGCGATKSYTATDQLLMSDAVDSTISKIDFRPINFKKVYLDTTYSAAAGKSVPGSPTPVNLVTSDYVISALRQQMVAAGCLLVEKREDAEIICEVRCGALGTDGHSVVYGIPASNAFGGVGSLIPGAPAAIPAIPEIAFAKRELKSAATKVAVFAYDRETREPVWQSGIAQAGSNARDTWVMGVGPWQYGTIYRGTRFAGKRIKGTEVPELRSTYAADQINGVDHREGFLFDSSQKSHNPSWVGPVTPPTTEVPKQMAELDSGSSAETARPPAALLDRPTLQR